jgi:hypothetical protein
VLISLKTFATPVHFPQQGRRDACLLCFLGPLLFGFQYRLFSAGLGGKERISNLLEVISCFLVVSRNSRCRSRISSVKEDTQLKLKSQGKWDETSLEHEKKLVLHKVDNPNPIPEQP